METVESFLAQPVEELLDGIASETPAPGGGSVSALVVAMAAGLVALAAGFACAQGDAAAPTAARAAEPRPTTAPLAPGDSAAYEEVLTAMRLPTNLEPEVRNKTIGNALARAAEIPLEIAGRAARASANLVEINLGTTASDPRVAIARARVAAAREAADRALALGPEPASATGSAPGTASCVLPPGSGRSGRASRPRRSPRRP